MVAYPLNLLRSRPLTLLQRPRVARALALYLLVAGGLLAWESNHAVGQVLAARRQGSETAARHTQFLREHPDVADVETYTAARRRQLEDQGAALTAITRVLARQRPVSALVNGLLAPLSTDVSMQYLELNCAAGTVRFELTVPLESTGGKADVAVLLAAWKRHPVLQRWMTSLHEVSNEESQMAGSAVFVVRFEGALTAQEG